jgi:hypothetical protein
MPLSRCEEWGGVASFRGANGVSDRRAFDSVVCVCVSENFTPRQKSARTWSPDLGVGEDSAARWGADLRWEVIELDHVACVHPGACQ